jgi:hypothetical protein
MVERKAWIHHSDIDSQSSGDQFFWIGTTEGGKKPWAGVRRGMAAATCQYGCLDGSSCETYFYYCPESSSDRKLSIEKACNHVSIYSDRYVSGVQYVAETVGVQKRCGERKMLWWIWRDYYWTGSGRRFNYSDKYVSGVRSYCCCSREPVGRNGKVRWCRKMLP